jgi:hypothetical protein
VSGYSKSNLEEIEPAGPTGAVRFVRRELGLEAFGITMVAVGARRGSYEPRGPF